MSAAGKKIIYNDLYFRIIAALIAAHVIVVIGEDETFFHLLVDKDYYRAMFFSFIIAFLLVNMVYMVTRWLDKKNDWQQHKIRRPLLQFFFALFLPSVIAFLLAYIYFKTFGYDIWHTWYLRYDYPVIVSLLLMLNIYYLAFYFYRQWQYAERLAAPPNDTRISTTAKGKSTFLVQKGAKNMPLHIEKVAYFYHDGHYNFVRTFDRQDHLISQALDEVQKEMDDRQFFRANRQMLVSFSACEHYEPNSYGKLQLFVSPPVNESVIISQKRAKLFKEWIER